MVAATIFLGTFVTVMLANRGGQIDGMVPSEVQQLLDLRHPALPWLISTSTPEQKAVVLQEQADLDKAAGLDLPYWPRQVVWTIKALRLDWKDEVFVNALPGSVYPSRHVPASLLTDLPHSLLLIATSFLLLFVLGIPLALYLFHRQGSRLDRLVALLAPLSSVPSFVFLEATLGFFNVKSAYPTWGRIIYEALRYGASYGSSFWVLEPVTMLLLTALAFAMLGFGLERSLNPKINGRA